MKTFQVNKNIRLEAETYETRYSWGHKAYLYLGGRLVDQAKIRYYNRTWERYTYEDVLFKLAESKELTESQAFRVKKYLKDYDRRVDDDLGGLRSIATIAKMGEILAPTQKAKNDWKTRMLKAGLEGKGLIMPENWDSLTEAEKEKRLNGAINQLSK